MRWISLTVPFSFSDREMWAVEGIGLQSAVILLFLPSTLKTRIDLNSFLIFLDTVNKGGLLQELAWLSDAKYVKLYSMWCTLVKIKLLCFLCFPSC